MSLAAPSTFVMRLTLYAMLARPISILAPGSPRISKRGLVRQPSIAHRIRHYSVGSGATGSQLRPQRPLLARRRDDIVP